MNDPDAREHLAGRDKGERDARRIARLRERHWAVLLISITVIVLAFCLEVQHGERVAVTGWFTLPLPDLCSSRAWFGIRCPGCGLTRSFVHLAHGRFAESLAVHRVGWVLAVIILLQVPYRIISLRASVKAAGNSRWRSWVSTALIAILVGNWVLEQLADRLE